MFGKHDFLFQFTNQSSYKDNEKLAGIQNYDSLNLPANDFIKLLILLRIKTG